MTVAGPARNNDTNCCRDSHRRISGPCRCTAERCRGCWPGAIRLRGPVPKLLRLVARAARDAGLPARIAFAASWRRAPRAEFTERGRVTVFLETRSVVWL